MTTSATRNCSGQLLALVVAANGRIDPCELDTLDGLEAFRRIGVPRDRFLLMAEDALEDMGMHLSQAQWLRWRDRLRIAALQEQVVDPGRQLLLCRLAAAVIVADGRVTWDERLIYSAMLSTWNVSQTMVAHAIMNDRVGRGLA